MFGDGGQKANMAALLIPFLTLAVIGLILSLIAHTAALFGLPQPLGSAAWGLHIGIFVVWLPGSDHVPKVERRIQTEGLLEGSASAGARTGCGGSRMRSLGTPWSTSCCSSRLPPHAVPVGLVVVQTSRPRCSVGSRVTGWRSIPPLRQSYIRPLWCPVRTPSVGARTVIRCCRPRAIARSAARHWPKSCTKKSERTRSNTSGQHATAAEPAARTPCRWFRPANADRTKDSPGLAGAGERGVGQPVRWPELEPDCV